MRRPYKKSGPNPYPWWGPEMVGVWVVIAVCAVAWVVILLW